MPARVLAPAAVLLAGLIGMAGCGSKKDSDDDTPSGGTSGTGTARTAPQLPPGVSRPPYKGTVVTAGWNGVRTAAARSQSQNNLHQIAIGFHNIESTYGQGFPIGMYDATGKTLGLSWRVALLPYIEETALFQQFHFDEPWDSEHNRKLIPKMPKTFAPPGDDVPKGYTYYQAVVGPNTAMPPPRPNPGTMPGRPQIPSIAFGRRITEIVDGTSNTVLVVEAAEPVIWTKPDDLEYDTGKPIPKLGGVFETGAMAALCDGSAWFFTREHIANTKNMRRWFLTNDGEMISDR